MTIHDAIDQAMFEGECSAKADYIDGVLGPWDEERQTITADIEQHVPFVALHYSGSAEAIQLVLAGWLRAADRHWGFWLRIEGSHLKLYTIQNEDARLQGGPGKVQTTLWFSNQEYNPTKHSAKMFHTALTVTNRFVLFLLESMMMGGHDEVHPRAAITLQRVNGDEFVARDVGDIPPDVQQALAKKFSDGSPN